MLNDMRITTRLYVMAAVLASALVGMAFVLDATLRANTAVARQEQVGLRAARDLVALMDGLQRHRGASAAFHSGAAEFRDAMVAAAAAVDRTLAEVQARIDAGDRGPLAGFPEQWRDLRARVERDAAAAIFAAHTQMIERVLDRLHDVVRDSGLALDPAAETYHLIDGLVMSLPGAIEHAARARGLGARLIAAGSPSMEQKLELMLLNGHARAAERRTTYALRDATRARPASRERLGEVADAAQRASAAFADVVEKRVLLVDTPAIDAKAYFEQGTAAVNAGLRLFDVGAAEIDTLLSARSTALERERLAVMAGCIVAIGIAFLLAWLFAANVAGRIRLAVERTRHVARGDLRPHGVGGTGGADEIGVLLRSLEEMRIALNHTTLGVRGSADRLETAARTISSSSDELSRRTEEQAASLQETATSLAHLADTVGTNAATAVTVSRLAADAAVRADEGGAIIAEVVGRMNVINASSHRVAEIVSVIDGIAFQTNILALNAAVEAARAGEHGRGFAVVASEVRNLAQRSASAAREVKELIGDSVEKVDAGKRLVDQAGGVISAIVSAVRKVTEHITEISHASQDQSSSIAQVNATTGELARVTQENAQVVQAIHAIALDLHANAEGLSAAVRRYELSISADAPAPAGTTNTAGDGPAEKPDRVREEAAGPWSGAERRGPDRARNVTRLRPGGVTTSPDRETPVRRVSGDDWESF